MADKWHRVADDKLRVWQSGLVYALAVMDDKGRSIPTNRMALWGDQWDSLRASLLAIKDEIALVRWADDEQPE